VIEIHDRRKIDVHAEAAEAAPLMRRVMADRHKPLGRIAVQRDDFGQRWLAHQRR